MRYLGLVLLLLPTLSEAAVTINEVSWMGSTDSANHEWIELYNDGSSVVSLDGWILSDGMNLEISLTGTIGADAYAVLERTSEASAPGTALLLYTGALVNTGATLSLHRADGQLEDQVGGGENWENIGGDNVTKETAQYTTNGWITAVPTPGASNKTEGTISTEDDDESIQKSAGNSSPAASSNRIKSSSEPVRLELPGVTLQLAVDAQTVGYVNQSIEFTLEASGIGDTLLDSLEYHWNFGDGENQNGKTATHHFSFPGTYLVTVYASYKRQEQVARHEITILPVALSLTRNQAGDLQINNDSRYEVDVSGYQVHAQRNFLFAPRTILLPGQTIALKGERVGGNAHVTDTTGAVVVTEKESIKPLNTPKSARNVVAVATQPVPVKTAVNGNFGFRSDTAEPDEVSVAGTTTEPELIVIGDSEEVGDSGQPDSSPTWPYTALVLLIGTAVFALVYRPDSQ